MTTLPETTADFRRELQTGATRDAINALRQVCRNEKAPAQARATAGTAILRAAGLFAPVEAADDEKPLHELTAAELSARIERLRTEREAIAREIEAAQEGEDPSGTALFD